MKKLVSTLLALALCLSLGAACAAEYTVPGLCTITYDDTVLTMDNETYVDENTDAYHWCFLLYNDLYSIDMDMEQLEAYEGLSLFSATDEEKEAYKTALMEDMDAAFLSVLEVPVGSFVIPFYIFSSENEEGPYLMAETVTQGTAIDFYAYYNDATLPVDDALTEALTTLVATFKPEQ